MAPKEFGLMVMIYNKARDADVLMFFYPHFSHKFVKNSLFMITRDLGITSLLDQSCMKYIKQSSGIVRISKG